MSSMVLLVIFQDQVLREVVVSEMFRFYVLWERTLASRMMEMEILPMMERLIPGFVILTGKNNANDQMFSEKNFLLGLIVNG